MSKISGYVRLMRPVNCVMMGFAVIIGAALASPENFTSLWSNLAYGFLTGFMLTAASMAANDYYDLEIDAVNEPGRPIPSGVIRPREALGYAFILTMLGFSTAYLTSTVCLLAAAVAWLMFMAYIIVGKRSGLPGNFLVSACVAIPFVYGSIVITSEVRLSVLFFSSMAFLSNTGREITKGIVDVEGDRAQNVKTLAVRYKEKTAAIAAVVFYISAVVLSPLPWVLNLVSTWYIPLVAVTDLGLVATSLLLLRDCSRETSRMVKRLVLAWFFVGLLAFIAGVTV